MILRGGRGALFAVLAATAAAATCSGDPGAGSQGTASTVPAIRILAEGVSGSPRLRVQVVEIERTGPEVLSVSFRLVNPDPATAVEVGNAFSDGPAEPGSISGAYLEDEGGSRKYFVLRDGLGQPQCTGGLGRIAPGGRVEAWGRFPAPAPGVTLVTVQIPGVTPLRGLPVPGPSGGTGRAGPSY